MRSHRVPIHDLRGESARVQAASAQESKCGTCQSLVVKPNEMMLAQIARPAGMCGPGSYCFGGPVRGWCSHHNVQKLSTELCDAYEAGGPSMAGLAMGGVGSAAREPSPLKEYGVTALISATVIGLAVAFDKWRNEQ